MLIYAIINTMSAEALAPQENSQIPIHSRIAAAFQERFFPSHFADELTGLGNRAAFNLELGRKIHKQPGNFALLTIDLDGLKEANDRRGHKAGDTLIQQAGIGISESIRVVGATPEDEVLPSSERREQELDEADNLFQVKRGWLGKLARVGGLNKVFRWGGDEFHAVLNGVDDPEIVASIITRIEKNLTKKGISASIGGAIHEAGMTGSVLCDQADQAMYAVKGQRKEQQRREEIAAAPLHKRTMYRAGTFLTHRSGVRERRR